MNAFEIMFRARCQAHFSCGEHGNVLKRLGFFGSPYRVVLLDCRGNPTREGYEIRDEETYLKSSQDGRR